MKLKPCPFCKNAVVLYEFELPYGYYQYSITCRGVEKVGGMYDKERSDCKV